MIWSLKVGKSTYASTVARLSLGFDKEKEMNKIIYDI